MNNSPKHTLYTGLLGVIFLLSGCSQDYLENDDLTSRGRWVQSGLDQVSVNRLKMQGKSIFAATSQGMFSRLLVNETIPWEMVGLKNEDVLDFVILGGSEIIAGVSYESQKSERALIFRTDDAGETWQEYQNNFKNIFRAIDRHPIDPLILYARGSLVIAKSLNGGLTWKSVYYDWNYGASSRFVKVDKKNPSIIWGGGSNTIGRAILAKSFDSGKSWETIQRGGEANVYDLVIHPNDSKTVLAGLMGFSNRIDKSTDGGKTWKVVNRSFGARALTNSKLGDNVVYASGSHREGKLFFAYSTDYGETWELEIFKNGPDRMYVNDLLVMPQDQGEVLYLGTNKGVYKFGILYPGL